MTDGFFSESTDQSKVKTAIVTKYFDAWRRVIIPSVRKRGANKIGYVDLFAGPGIYDDGTESTPIKILKKAIADPDLRSMLVCIFNDVNCDYAKRLEKHICSIPGISELKTKPVVWNENVGEKIVQTFSGMKVIPTLLFVDPWGYKGLSLKLIGSFLKDWGCDCIFFFNYNRVNAGINNPVVNDHMDALFGKKRADDLRQRLPGMRPDEREIELVEELVAAINELGYKYVLPFGFKNDSGVRTSHHLIFVSKSVRGYSIMKEIMARESSDQSQGVASFVYNPADKYRHPRLFEFTRPLDDLEDLLLSRFAGQRLTLKQVYEQHNVGTPYILKNYRDVIRKLETEGRITADPSSEKRKKGTFAGHVWIAFPQRVLSPKARR